MPEEQELQSAMEKILNLINEEKFEELEKELEDLDVEADLDVTLAYLSTASMCYPHIEKAYRKFYTRACESHPLSDFGNMV